MHIDNVGHLLVFYLINNTVNKIDAYFFLKQLMKDAEIVLITLLFLTYTVICMSYYIAPATQASPPSRVHSTARPGPTCHYLSLSPSLKRLTWNKAARALEVARPG